MNFLTILKDSVREAIDSKVFYVTVGMSGLVILLVASVSFKPVPAAEALPHMASQLLIVYRDRGHSQVPIFPPLANYDVSDIEALTQDAEPQAANYRFTFQIHTSPDKFRKMLYLWSKPADRSDDKENVKDTQSSQVAEGLAEEFIKEQFSLVGNLDVVRVTKIEEDVKKTKPATGEKREVASKERGHNPFAMFKVAATTTLRYQVETRGTTAVRGWQHDPSVLFGAWTMRFMRGSLGSHVYLIEDYLVNGIGAWVTILLGVVVTSFFIPNLLQKGSIDLLLVKPIHRSVLLVYKYLGGLVFMFLNAAIAVIGIWLVLGLRSGIWATGFLITIFVMTFFFAILYAVSALFGVLTRSAIVAILMTCGAWFIFWFGGWAYSWLDLRRNEAYWDDWPRWIFLTGDTAHYVLPRTRDLDRLTTGLLAREVLTNSEIRLLKLDQQGSISWGESLTVSGVFVGLMLGLACWRFATKDY